MCVQRETAVGRGIFDLPFKSGQELRLLEYLESSDRDGNSCCAMTSRGALDRTQALLLSAFDDLLCRLAAITFGVDSLNLPLLLASLIIKLDIPDSASLRALYAEVRHVQRGVEKTGHKLNNAAPIHQH